MKANSATWLRLIPALACAAAAWTVFSSDRITAQGGLTITSPASGAILAAGPDYATEVLGDPWDFSNVQDIAPDPDQHRFWLSGPTVSGGIVSGTTTAANGDNAIMTVTRALDGINNPGRNGRNFPVETAKYSKIGIKFTHSRSDQFPRFLWWHPDIPFSGPQPPNGSRLLSENSIPSPSGTRINVLDMINVPVPAQQPGPAWNSSAFVKGLAFYPNHSNVSSNIQVDWMRLTTGDARSETQKVNIAWTGGSGSINVTVTDSGGSTYTIATGQPGGGGSINWNHGVLPPGSYTLNVGAASRPFTINAPPIVHVTDPDETGGEDFATTLLGNPWDMHDSADYVVNVNIVDHLTSRSTDGAGFHGTSDGLTVSNPPPAGDPQLYLLSKQVDGSGPTIDSTKYHRLTYNLQVDHAYNLTTGSIARVLWGWKSSPTGGGTPYDMTTSKDIKIWEGMNSYTLDLATMTVANGGLENVNVTPWTAQPMRHLRLDAFEFPEVVNFHVRDVKLAADDATSGGKFMIKFSGSDPNGDATTMSFFYDTDQNPANGMTAITSGIPLANGQYQWLTGTSVPAGLYYIYYVANDGRNSVGRYSTGPVRVIPAPLPAPSNVDFDNDGRSDMAIYKADGSWAVRLSGGGYSTQFVNTWGGPTYVVAPGDYDGDGKQDLAAYREGTGVWSIAKSSTNFTTALTILHGGFGKKAVQGDYDGDKKTDPAVYTLATGEWSILTSSSNYTTTLSFTFGSAGWVPVGGQDFDADGKADICAYNVTTGVWSALRSGTNYTSTISAAWGGGNYTLVPGDYDADGKADFALYQNQTGQWLVLKSSSNNTTSLTVGWGGPGYAPVPGDYDGDGVTDIAVFQRSTGNWLVLRSSSNYTTSFTVAGHGLGADKPLSSAVAPTSEPTRTNDFDRDLRSDLIVFQPSTGNWSVLKSSSNFTTPMNAAWGAAGDTLQPGDYDGDGKTDYAIYRAWAGSFYAVLSGTNFTTSLVKTLGGSGWVAVAGDIDGDGVTDPVVYNTTTGVWNGLKSGSNYSSFSITWGGTGYAPAPGDFDGDGKMDMGLYVAATAAWNVLLSGSNYNTTLAKFVGGPSWVPIQSDFDADGRTDLAVYNPSSGGWYVSLSGSNYMTSLSTTFGGPGYTPVRGDWDGDGKQDLAIYQNSTGGWTILLSGTNFNTALVKTHGGSGFTPVPKFN